MDTYKKAYTEILEILSYFSDEEYSKIPTDIINFYEENKDKNYIYKINPDIDLTEQYISKKANAILVSLFRDYFATPKQKATLNNLLNQNQEILEKEKTEKYNSDNLFNENRIVKTNNISQKTGTDIIEYKETFFINFIKKLLKK